MRIRALAFLMTAFGLLALGPTALPVGANLPLTQDGRGFPTLAPLLVEVTPSVVNISVVTRRASIENPLLRDPFFRRFFNMPERPRARPQQSAGSGVIVDATQGYVVTNRHVVADADKIIVTLRDRRQFEAELLGSDPGTDIALLRIEPDELVALSVGDSDSLKVGDFVVAIGNPFGLGQTVTSGIVSALGRSGLNIEGYEDFIQTDASINPGNSGGALVNLKGELIGINTAILAPSGGNIGIGFAVPSNMARAVMDQLINYGEVRRGRLGVVVQDLTPDLAEALGVDVSRGAVITQVRQGSSADQAGLKAGDVVVEINGRPVRGSTDLRNKVGLTRIGENLELKLYREGELRTLKARVGEAVGAALRGDDAVPQLAGAVFSDIRQGMPLYGKIEGVLVAKLERVSPAWQNGLRRGDVIVAVNRRRVKSVDELTQVLKGAGRTIALDLVRGNSRMMLVIQ